MIHFSKKLSIDSIDLETIYPVGSLYFETNNINPSTIFGFGTWVLRASKLPIGENVFGNGKALGLTNGTLMGGLSGHVFGGGTSMDLICITTNSFGQNAHTDPTNFPAYTSGVFYKEADGVPTKEQLDNHSYPYSYTGLEMQSITVNIWQRTA